MKNRYKKILFITLLNSFGFLSIHTISDLSENKNESVMGANPYTYSPLLFDAENAITGKYWAGNKQYPSKAYIQDIEYKNIIIIKKNQLELKSKKKLRKNKDFLGSYIDAKTNTEFYLYGNKKNPDTVDNSPDGDVITMIAIKNDYGIGE